MASNLVVDLSVRLLSVPGKCVRSRFRCCLHTHADSGQWRVIAVSTLSIIRRTRDRFPGDAWLSG